MENQEENSMSIESMRPLNVFFCYVYEDGELVNELERHLIPLKRLGLITTWVRQSWVSEVETEEKLNSADMILLLVSPYFIGSDYVYEKLMGRALERFYTGKARVIAIILRPVLWEFTPIRTFPILPTKGKPITSWSEQDEAFTFVTKGISKVIMELLPQRVKEYLEATLFENMSEEPPVIDTSAYGDVEHNIAMVPTEPINVYFCFADQDVELQQDLERHLAPLKRSKWITTWSRHNMLAGQRIDFEIATHLDKADIILLLISPDFITQFSSDTNFFPDELPRALGLYKNDQTRAAAILFHSVNWEDTLIKELPVLPIDGKPITSWPDRDEALRNVVEGISGMVSTFFIQRTREHVEEIIIEGEPELAKQSPTQDEVQYDMSYNIASGQIKGINIFFCYAYEDKALMDAFEKHLATLRISQLINSWHKRNIRNALKRERDVDPWLKKADMILLMVSADFLASDYYGTAEMRQIFDMYQQGEVPVILVVLRPVDWRGSELDRLPALPSNDRAVTIWSNYDEAFQDIIKGVREIINLLLFERLNKPLLDKINNAKDTRRFEEVLAAYRQAALGKDIISARQNKSLVELKKYDIALSYASEDRLYADALAQALRQRGVRVFYDKYETSTLWGQNLYTYLSDLYQNQARYCVLFLSQYYATKLWTTREREAAQARAINELKEYILPIRLDDTAIPGLLPTIAYIDWKQQKIEDIVGFLIRKLRDKR